MIACMIFLVPLAFAHGLESYPEMYVSNGKVNAQVVVGSNAPASYVIQQTGIALSLNDEAGSSQQGVAMLDSEITTLTKNTISIGNPCENKVSAMILHSGDDCLAGFKPGIAKIELVYDEESRLTHIVAAGYTQKGTLEAAKRLKDAQDNRFGQFTIVEFNINDPIETKKEIEEVPTHDITQETEEKQTEEQSAPPAKEHQQGQQEIEQNAQEPKETEGFFKRLAHWLASLFG